MQQQPSRKKQRDLLRKQLSQRPPRDLPQPPEPPPAWKPLGVSR